MGTNWRRRANKRERERKKHQAERNKKTRQRFNSNIKTRTCGEKGRNKTQGKGEEDHHLPIPYLLLHLSSFPRVPPKHQQSRGEPVQPVDCPQVLQAKLLHRIRCQTRKTTGLSHLGEDEDDGVMPVPPARMDL